MSVNKVILLGNVGQDPNVRYLDTGVAVAEVSLATTERAYSLQNGTQVPERTEWHRLIFWRGLAEVVDKYVHKGDKIYVEGKIKSRSYDDKAGIKRYITEIFVDNMEMLSPKNGEHTRNSANQNSANQPTDPSSRTFAPADNVVPIANEEPASDDDLPF